MAILVDTRWIAETVAGVRLPGAKLYVYEQGPGPLATLWADVDLTVPLANPVVADADGIFPLIYGAADTYVDADLKTAGDIIVRTYTDIPLLAGEDSDIFERDFSSDGRLSASGSGGRVHLEFGNQSGDNIGGAGRIGGWNGTPGDDLEIDFDAVDITGDSTVAGDAQVGGDFAIIGTGFTVGGKRVDVVELSGTVVAGSASLIVPLPATCDGYELTLLWIVPSATATINMHFSYDNGATYKTGAFYDFDLDNTGVTVDASSIPLLVNLNPSQSGFGCIQSKIFSKAGKATVVFSRTWNNDAGSGAVPGGTVIDGATNVQNFGKATHVRITPSTGTFEISQWMLRTLRTL